MIINVFGEKVGYATLVGVVVILTFTQVGPIGSAQPFGAASLWGFMDTKKMSVMISVNTFVITHKSIAPGRSKKSRRLSRTHLVGFTPTHTLCRAAVFLDSIALSRHTLAPDRARPPMGDWVSIMIDLPLRDADEELIAAFDRSFADIGYAPTSTDIPAASIGATRLQSSREKQVGNRTYATLAYCSQTTPHQTVHLRIFLSENSGLVRGIAVDTHLDASWFWPKERWCDPGEEDDRESAWLEIARRLRSLASILHANLNALETVAETDNSGPLFTIP